MHTRSGQATTGFLLALILSTTAALPAASLAGPGDKQGYGHSERYGPVTPSQVYALLQNYEKLFMYYVRTHNKALLPEIDAVTLVPVKNMTPENAFVMINRLSDSIDKLTARVQQEPMQRVKRERKLAIPAEVFLQAGNNLDAFVHYLHSIAPGKTWGRFYTTSTYKTGKKPDDVYALAELSVRRLNIILQHSKGVQPVAKPAVKNKPRPAVEPSQ